MPPWQDSCALGRLSPAAQESQPTGDVLGLVTLPILSGSGKQEVMPPGWLIAPINVLAVTVKLPNWIVGSEEARLRASLRPPPKLHVQFSRMQLSRRHVT
ncbi:MAG TPA: hypothetical protein VFN26_22740 [Candidatus Acidoferrum sp.]|nr:hypothetical protein [Candidatus Acidoferrum sp.]